MDIKQLLDTIGSAVQEAHKAIAQSSAEFYLNNYFTQDNESNAYIPKTVDIKISSGEGEKTISAPMAVLINQGCLNIDSLKLNLNIEIQDQGENVFCVSPATAGDNQSGAKTGEMEIVFKCSETSEGASRVITRLNSLL